MQKGKGGQKSYDVGDGATYFEWYKVFVGHLHTWVTDSQLRTLVSDTMGFAPQAVHFRRSPNRNPNAVGCSSAFVVFATPGRLSQIDGVASNGATRL